MIQIRKEDNQKKQKEKKLKVYKVNTHKKTVIALWVLLSLIHIYNMKKIRSYTSIWSVEKVLYSINDFKLPFPITFTQMAWFVVSVFTAVSYTHLQCLQHLFLLQVSRLSLLSGLLFPLLFLPDYKSLFPY